MYFYKFDVIYSGSRSELRTLLGVGHDGGRADDHATNAHQLVNVCTVSTAEIGTHPRG